MTINPTERMRTVEPAEEMLEQPKDLAAEAQARKERLMRAFGVYIEQPMKIQRGNYYPSEQPVTAPNGRQFPESGYPYSV